jgi:dipeptide/tripeptide permease
VPVDAEAVKQRRDNAAVTFGAVLVVVGVVLLGGRFNDVVAAGGPALSIGLGLLTWWAFNGRRGLLVLGGVLIGVGVGLMLDEIGFSGGAATLGLGAGLLAIFALDVVRRRRRASRWPLLLGVALVLVGLLGDTSAWASLGALAWPLVLIVLGGVFVGSALRRRRSRR